MPRNVGNWKMPFYADNGEPVWYLWYDQHTYNPQIIWKDNPEFVGSLVYEGFERGRSAAHMLFKDGAGVEYHMFLKDFDDLLKSGPGLKGRLVEGVFGYCKRGQNFGIYYVREATDEDRLRQALQPEANVASG